MKVAIISDIHDNLINLEKCLAWSKANAVAAVICCGDIVNSETLDYLAKNFKGTIYLVRGNLEIYQEIEVQQYSNINYLGLANIFTLDNKKIGVCHQPDLIKEIIRQGQCDYIFYGHTHQPWLKQENSVKIINPGTLGGVFYKASFAVLDTETGELELKLLELI